MKRALPILVNILERETRGWFLHFRERLITELRNKKLSDDQIERVSFSVSCSCRVVIILQTDYLIFLRMLMML